MRGKKQLLPHGGTDGGQVISLGSHLCDEKYLGEDGKPDVERMNLITYEPVRHGYIQLGKTVGKAFSDGKQLK